MKIVHLVFGFDFIVAATGHLCFKRQLATKLSIVALRGNAGGQLLITNGARKLAPIIRKLLGDGPPTRCWLDSIIMGLSRWAEALKISSTSPFLRQFS